MVYAFHPTMFFQLGVYFVLNQKATQTQLGKMRFILAFKVLVDTQLHEIV